jgi:starch phosphorylase
VQDAGDLYRKLRADIIPMFYKDRQRWVDVMRQTIAFNASFFNSTVTVSPQILGPAGVK